MELDIFKMMSARKESHPDDVKQKILFHCLLLVATSYSTKELVFSLVVLTVLGNIKQQVLTQVAIFCCQVIITSLCGKNH